LAGLIGLIGLAEAGAAIPAEPLAVSPADLLAPLSEAGYLATAHQLGLTRPIQGLPAQAGLLPDFAGEGTVRDLAVTPLHLARVLAALELDGRLPTPILSPIADNGRTPALAPATAAYVRSILPQAGEQIIGLQGLASPEETGRPEWLSWFVGLAPAAAASSEAGAEMLPFDPAEASPPPSPSPQPERSRARYVVVAVVVTDGPDEELAFRIASAPLRVVY
jgi:hypothetical protein